MSLTFWSDLLQLAEGSVHREVITLWLAPLRPLLVSRDKIVLEAPNRIHAGIVRERYLKTIRRCARALSGRDVQVDFVLAPDAGESCASGAVRLPFGGRECRRFGPALNPDYRFERFVVGRCNKTAYSAAVSAAEDPGRRHNPLFITGAVGLGKTHLLQAICARAMESGTHESVFVPSDLLMDELVHAIGEGTVARVRKRLASPAILLVDDVHFLSGRNQIQEEFYSIFSTLHEHGRQIVLSSDRKPQEIPRLHRRLVARFQDGAVMELKPPALATRLAILERKARQLGLALPRQSLMLLASRIRSNIRRMEGALNGIAAYSAVSGRSPEGRALEELLDDVLYDGEAASVTIRRIQAKVAEHFEIRMSALLGGARSGCVTFPRHLAMYLCRKLVSSPYADIGAAFSGRDHTTALHACKTVEQLLHRSAEARETVDDLITAIRS